MGGDLGNLLTGEMGEAEARFAHEDFAGACGRRVAQRVRRRRTVRAVGAGGGTVLTAGALAVGASSVPWGAWGTAGVEPGASDCVTPSPSAFTYSARGELSEPTTMANGSVTWTDIAGTEVTVSQDASGAWWVSRGTDDPEPVLPDENGVLTVVSDDGERIAGVTVVDVLVDEEDATWIRYTVDGEGAAQADDCYTPSPTPSAQAAASASASASPSPDPTLAAKPEDVMGDSPFECGFEFPTENYGSDRLWIDGAEWLSPAEVDARHGDNEGVTVSWGSASRDAEVPRVTVNRTMPELADGDSASGFKDTGDPSLEKLGEAPLSLSAKYAYSEGRTFVGAVDGKVVATGTLRADDEAALASIFTAPNDEGALGSELMYLIDPSIALTSCDARPVDLTQAEIVAVAGLTVKYADGTVDPTVYAWLPVGTP